jgi:hypothetical protein
MGSSKDASGQSAWARAQLPPLLAASKNVSKGVQNHRNGENQGEPAQW